MKRNQNNRIEQVMKLDNNSYEEAKKDDTGYYSPASLVSYEDFVNFEMTVLHDQERTIQSVTPLVLNGCITYVIIYLVDGDDV